MPASLPLVYRLPCYHVRMAEESAVLNAVPAGRALKVVGGAGRAVRKSETRVEAAEPDKSLTGPGFWIIVAIVAFDELILDLLANLSVVFSIFVIFTSFLISAIIFGYLYFSGVSMDMSRLALLAGTMLIEMMPFLSIIPTALLSLFAIRWMVHNEQAKKLIEHRAKISSVPRAAPSRA